MMATTASDWSHDRRVPRPLAHAALRGVWAGVLASLAVGALVLAIRFVPSLALAYPLALIPLLAAGPLATGSRTKRPVHAFLAGLTSGATSALLAVGILWSASTWLGEPRWALMGPSSTLPGITLPRPAIVPGLVWPHQLILFFQPPLAMLLALLWSAAVAACSDGPTGRVRCAMAGVAASVETKLLYSFAMIAGLTIAVAWVGFSAVEDSHLRGHRFQLGADWATHVGELSALLAQAGSLVSAGDETTDPSRLEALGDLNRSRDALFRHLRSQDRHPGLWALAPTVAAAVARHGSAVEAADQAFQQHAEILASILSSASSTATGEELRLAERRAYRELSRLDGSITTELKQSLDAIDLDHHANLVGIMALLALVIALTGLVSRAIATAITDPIAAMSRHLSRLARGDFSGRLNVQNRDELGALARELNRVSGDLGRLYELERRQREGSEARYQALFHGLTDSILVADDGGRVLDANGAALELLGCTREDLIGRPVSTLLAAPTVGARTELACLEHWHGQFFLKGADGAWLPVESRATSVQQGDRVVHVAILRDIQERFQKDAELQDINQRLTEALEELQMAHRRVIQQERLSALGQMASGIAHDMNNSLAPVVGFSELLIARFDADESPEKLREYLTLIHTAAQDAANVVGRLRDYYRPPGDQVSQEAVDLVRLIDTVVSLTQPKWKGEALARGGPIEVVTDYGESLTIVGHASSLREALTNLVLNACDAMPSGGRLTLSAARQGDQVVISVSDTGLGMTEEARQRCFEPFFTTKGRRGTGLGLGMVWGVIQRHRGVIEVSSTLGEGSTFTIQLPMGEPDELVLPAERGPGERRITALRVLVVDDEPAVVRMIADMLSRFGHSAVCASDGPTALEMIQEQFFDLVITDRAMPGINGDQLARAVKRRNPDTPVILLTGFGELSNAAGEKPECVDLVLGKPVSMQSLNDAIASLSGLPLAA